MADDFGDYSGEKLFDWVMGFGRRSGGRAAIDAADRLKNAIGFALERIDPQSAAPRWAKLDMREFSCIGDWPALKELIGAKLRSCGIGHEWYEEKGSPRLLFRVEDAPALARAFEEMSQDADAARDKASAELARDLDRARDRAREAPRDRGRGGKAPAGAGERLAEKAEMARAAAEELRRSPELSPERARRPGRERGQGR